MDEKELSKNESIEVESDKKHGIKAISVNFKNFDRMKLLTILVFATFVLSVINSFGIFFSGEKSIITGNVIKEEDAPAPSLSPPDPSRVKINIEGAPYKGNKNAPIVMVEYSDYECPFCGKFYSETLPLIESQYINTGKVKFVYKDFPLSFHPNAQKAAEATRCVKEQNGDEGYWAIHDKIFENQQSLSIASLRQWANEIGLNIQQFDSCLQSGKMAAAVQKDSYEGQQDGVQGTPAFFINGEIISGAQPFPAFQQAIESELE